MFSYLNCGSENVNSALGPPLCICRPWTALIFLLMFSLLGISLKNGFEPIRSTFLELGDSGYLFWWKIQKESSIRANHTPDCYSNWPTFNSEPKSGMFFPYSNFGYGTKSVRHAILFRPDRFVQLLSRRPILIILYYLL